MDVVGVAGFASESSGSRTNVTGILPVHNEAKVLGKVLDAIDQQTQPVDEVLIILDRCTDRSGAIAEQRHCLTQSVAYGNTASSVMAGVRQAANSVLVLFDGNTLVPPPYVERVIQVLVREHADVVEWHGGMMALRKETIDRYGPFSTRFLWTLEYFLRVRAHGGIVVRLNGPHKRLRRSPLSRNIRYGLDYAELSQAYGLSPYFRVGTKSGWIPDLVALSGAVVGHARAGQLLSSVRRTTADLRRLYSDRRNHTTL